MSEPTGERVLVIEDDPQLRAAMVRLLGSRGFEVIEAESCAEADERLKQHRPDVVLTDYELPDGVSLDMMPRLRGPDGLTPVIFITGVGSIELAVKAIKAGAEQFLTKPVEANSLFVVMDRVLEAGRRREAMHRARSGAPNPCGGTSGAVRTCREQAERLAGGEG